MSRDKIRFGIIGLGLMGREIASSLARWCHLLDDGPIPNLTGICDVDRNKWGWYLEHFSSIAITTSDYRELISSPDIDAIYCAIPHHLHEQVYIDIIRANKHLLGEKPFGIDKNANLNILKAVEANPEVIVRCSSEFPYFPGALQLIRWLQAREYGVLIEVRAGFHHSSDMDLAKPMNWKRMVELNGESGCMGDLGMHTQHIPFRMGWLPKSVFADLQKIVRERPDGKGGMARCQTWDNAVLTCRAVDPFNSQEFSLVLETKRMAPGATNTWFIEIYGTEGSARFSTHEPKAFYSLKTTSKEQGWARVDLGSQSAIPSITGNIFEFGFSDAVLQMLGAFIWEFKKKKPEHPFLTVNSKETYASHCVMTAALASHSTGRRTEVSYDKALLPSFNS
jgi:predicted dehydrogenase